MSSGGGTSAPEPLGAHHVVDGFHCGAEELDTWLVKYALQDHRSNVSRTTVVCRNGRVVGFYSLAASGVVPEQAPQRVVTGMARHMVPVVALTRLGVDLTAQGSGLGSRLFRNALLKVVEVSDPVAVRALLVHAKDAEAKAWYLARARFAESPADPLWLFLLMKDIKTTLAALR